jgi:polygalacturonase
MRAPVGGKSQYMERPFTLFFIDSESVEISEVTIKDPAFWAFASLDADNASIHNMKILTDLMVPNADGIDIDRCQNVRIDNCTLITADDCISLKSCAGTAQYGLVENIIISNTYMKSTSGAITLGTEACGDIRNVIVSDCTVEDSHRGFAVRPREGGTVTNVHFMNCSDLDQNF